MGYYDNAVLMKLRLGLWRNDRSPKPYEMETELLEEIAKDGPRQVRIPFSGLLRWTS